MPHRRLYIGTAALVAATWVLIVFGSTVRAHGAGLACPDWPLCFGEVIPPLDFGVFLEFGHRVLASVISVGFVVLSVAILRDRDARSRLGWPLAIGAVLLVTQIILGGLTVLQLLAEWTVASHLVTGNAFCAILLVIALLARGAPSQRTSTRFGTRLAVAAVTVLLVAQLALGGVVSSSFAGLACGPVFPQCAGPTLAPTFSGPIGLQVMHRLLAVMLLVAATALAGYTWRRGTVGRVAAVMAVGVLLQGAIGVANVMLAIPVEVTLLHSAGAAILVLLATSTNVAAWQASEEPRRVGSAQMALQGAK